MEPVQELHEETCVLNAQSAHDKAALVLGAAHTVPGNEVFGTRSALLRVPEKGMMEGVQGFDHRRQQHESSHRMGRKRVQKGIDEDEASNRRKNETTPSRQILVSLGDEGDEGVQRELVAGEW
jgi:hypothetical protein